MTFATRAWRAGLFLSFAVTSLAQKDTAGRSALAEPLACANCHEREYASQAKTSMAHAMEPVSRCSILQQNPLLTFCDRVYSYRIERQANQSFYTITDGKDTVRVPLEYAFGLGKAGQTYIFERDGKMYESRVSFFKAMSGLDLTMGAQNLRPNNLAEAAGRLMDKRSAADCFGCHTTSASREGVHQSAPLTPGITCERCHESALAHVEGFRQRRPVEMKKLFAFSTEELSDFCGQCHRTWAQIATEGPHDINNVRFQPYRLANSKCYDPSDRRISCAACHDVHQEVVTSDSFYDRKCLACHAVSAHAAAVKPAAKNCRWRSKTASRAICLNSNFPDRTTNSRTIGYEPSMLMQHIRHRPSDFDCDKLPTLRHRKRMNPVKSNKFARRSFLKTAGLLAAGSFWSDEVLEALPKNTNTYSKPSELKITDMRVAVIGHAPMTCPLVRLDTESRYLWVGRSS